MSYCTKCKVYVSGETLICPLCQNVLNVDKNNNAPKEDVFPFIPTTYQKHNLFFRTMIFISIIVSVVCLAGNWIFPQAGWWSLFIIGGIACIWLSLAIIIKKRNNIPKTVLWQMMSLCILAFLWDLFTGWHKWSVNYIIPAVCTIAMITMAIVSKVMNLQVGDYLIYLVLDSFFGIIPILFLLTKLLTVAFPSVICISGSIISLAALLLFQGESMKAELKRRIHL